MTKEELIRVFVETLQNINDGFYRCFNVDTCKFDIIEFNRLRTLGGGSIFYDELKPIKKSDLPYFEKTEIYVENKDIILKAMEMGSKTVILNPASKTTPGGGVERGSKACEEEICRRTNLVYSLYSFTDYKKTPYTKRKEFGRYPLNTRGGIYSPQVTIYKGPASEYYQCYHEPSYTNVISVSAVNHPKVENDGKMSKSMVYLTKDKIRAIFRIAILNKHSKLILTAFGCGAYNNPASHVAEIFKEVIDEEEFKHSFEEIAFCILDDHNSIRPDNKEGNYKPFVNIFGEKK
jgi:uncharacterized protein (TIGR02452 family)